MDSEKVAAKFTAELKGLNCNSKPIITSLTRLADEYIRYAPVIVECIETHLSQVRLGLKLAVLYLIDSIVKNIRRDYVSLFSNNIVSTFTKSFEQLAKVDQVGKVKMMKLRNTWKDVFPESKLYNIDCICKMMDPEWSVQPSAPSNRNIHLNRKFLAIPKGSSASSSTSCGETLPLPPSVSSTVNLNRLSSSDVKVGVEVTNSVIELREELLLKEKKLLELQTQKLKLEVLQAQAQLEEQARERMEFDSSYLNQVLLQRAETARQQTQIATSLLSSAPASMFTSQTPRVTSSATTPPSQEIKLALPNALPGTDVTRTLSPQVISSETETSDVRNSPQQMTCKDQIEISSDTDSKTAPLTVISKPYYKGYDPSNVYDTTPTSDFVLAFPKSPMQNQNLFLSERKYKDRESDVESENEDNCGWDNINTTEKEPKFHRSKPDIDITVRETVNHHPIKSSENICQAKSTLKRSSATFTASVSESDSDFNQCQGETVKTVARTKTNLTNVQGDFNADLMDTSKCGTAGATVSEYPPMKKQRQTNEHVPEEGFRPINDLFGGEDVDLRQSSSSASSLGRGNAIVGAQSKLYTFQKNKEEDSPLTLTPDNLKGDVSIDFDPRQRSLPRQPLIPSNLQVAGHRLVPPINPKLNLPSEFPSSTHRLNHHNGSPALVSIQDGMRNNARWNPSTINCPLAKSSLIGTEIGSSSYNNWMSGMRISGGLAGSLAPNPWVEGSKVENIWNSVGPVSNGRFYGPGWHQNALSTDPSTHPPLWRPQPSGPNPFEEAMGQPLSHGFAGQFLIPPVNMAEYESITKDVHGTVPIDGILRKVRFYGETAIVFQGINGDEPREISFRAKEPRSIYIDKEREPVRCFFDKPSVFFFNHKRHVLRLGAPTREIYIDGDHYEASFGGEPIVVRSGDGAMHRLKLEGPPPKVHVGKILRNDLVAGKLNLFTDGHRRDIYLDDKPQLYELPTDDYPLILRFCDGFHTFTINGRPFPTHFGGPPITVTVPGGQRHQIGLSALSDSTRNAMTRYLKYKSQEFSNATSSTSNHTSLDFPMPQTEIGTTQSPTQITGLNIDKDLASQSRNPIHSSTSDAGSTNIAQEEDATSALDNFSAMTDSASSGANSVATLALATPTSATRLSPESCSTETVEADQTERTFEPVSLAATVNVHDLLLKLKVAGLLPADTPGKQMDELEIEPAETKKVNENNKESKIDGVTLNDKGGGASTTKNSKRQKGLRKRSDSKKEIRTTPPLPPLEIVDVDFSQLKQRIPAVVAQIWTGTQCSSCGFRFPPDQSQKFSEHLDWHFRNNRKTKLKGKKISRRQFYYQLADWMQYSEFEEKEDRARSMFEVQAAEKLALSEESGGREGVSVSWMNPELHTAPCKGHEDAVCPQCGESFETYFDEEKEEWRFKEACLSYDEAENHIRRVFHILCYKDLLASLEGKSVLSYVTASNENVLSETKLPAPVINSDLDDNGDDVVILKEGKPEVEVMDILEDDETPVVQSFAPSINFPAGTQNVEIKPNTDSAATAALTIATEPNLLSSCNKNGNGVTTTSPNPCSVIVLDGDIHSDSTESIHSENEENELKPQPSAMSEVSIVTDTSYSAQDGPLVNFSSSDHYMGNETETAKQLETTTAGSTVAISAREALGNSSESESSAIVTTEFKIVAVSESQEMMEDIDAGVGESEGDISVVKIDLSEGHDVIPLSPPVTANSSNHALCTMEGNIPLNGHTPLTNKVGPSVNVRIRIQDAILNDERSRSPKPSAKVKAPEGPDVTNTSVTVEEEGKGRVDLVGCSAIVMPIASSNENNSNKKSNSGSPQIICSSSVSVLNQGCTEPANGYNVIELDETDMMDESIVILSGDENPSVNINPSPKQNVFLIPKSAAFSRTVFTDCPPKLTGKETSGLCVIS